MAMIVVVIDYLLHSVGVLVILFLGLCFLCLFFVLKINWQFLGLCLCSERFQQLIVSCLLSF